MHWCMWHENSYYKRVTNICKSTSNSSLQLSTRKLTSHQKIRNRVSPCCQSLQELNVISILKGRERAHQKHGKSEKIKEIRSLKHSWSPRQAYSVNISNVNQQRVCIFSQSRTTELEQSKGVNIEALIAINIGTSPLLIIINVPLNPVAGHRSGNFEASHLRQYFSHKFRLLLRDRSHRRNGKSCLVSYFLCSVDDAPFQPLD